MHRRWGQLLTTLGVGVVLATTAWAQPPQAQLAAVTVTPAADRRVRVVAERPDGFRARSATVPQILAYAFETEEWLIVCPDWMRTALFDVDAPPGPGMRQVVREAMEKQLQLTSRTETRLVEVWVMRRQPHASKTLQAADLLAAQNNPGRAKASDLRGKTLELHHRRRHGDRGACAHAADEPQNPRAG